MKIKYKSNIIIVIVIDVIDKSIYVILDNLWAHKTSYIMRIASDKRIFMLLTPSNTPQFSPIVNFYYGFNDNTLGEYVLCTQKKNENFDNQK